MKKGNFIVCILVGFAIYAANTSCNTIEKSSLYPSLLTRKDTNGIGSEFANLQAIYQKCVTALKKDSNDDVSKLKLVELYINEARVTGNSSYYHEGSLRLINTILSKAQIQNDIAYKAMAYKASVLLSLHQFKDAKEIALKALQLNPYDADIYGALVDANVELGLYEEATQMCDKMMSIRPDIRSYSRASYIHQIYGDLQGAKASMRMAVESGAQGMENTEWARVQLGDLYLNTGDIDTAKMLYESSLYVRPSYAYAEMGMARALSGAKQYDSAIAHCKRAIRLMSESSFIAYLAELNARKGDKLKAMEIHEDVLALLLEAEAENNKSSFARHNGNRELAMAYLYTNKLDEALKYSKIDLNLRPNNIDANELVAWIYFLKGDGRQAKQFMDKALATDSRNLITVQRAAQIYQLAGDASLNAKYTNLLSVIQDRPLVVNN